MSRATTDRAKNREATRAMPDHSRSGDSFAGDADSSGGLLKAIRKLFDNGEADTSLRAQLEEAIDEHEDEQATGAEVPAKGDLSPIELTMLRNLLHFSEHDADDVAIPRSEIVAISADATWDELVAHFAEHGHSRMPVYRGTLDEVIGMMHLRDVFAIIATGLTPPEDWSTLMRQPLYVPQAQELEVLRLVLDRGRQRIEMRVHRIVERAAFVGQLHRLARAREQLSAGEILEIADPPRQRRRAQAQLGRSGPGGTEADGAHEGFERTQRRESASGHARPCSVFCNCCREVPLICRPNARAARAGAGVAA